MNEHPVNEALPEAVLKALAVLERWTGRIPLAYAVTGITLTGLILTALIVSAVAWGERHRVQGEFRSLVSRYQMVIQARLDHRQMLLDQVAHWTSEQTRLSGRESSTWSASGVTVLRPQDLDADMLSGRLDLDDEPARVVVDCLRRAPASQPRVLCAIPSAPLHDRAWLLAVRVAAPGQGWVMAPFEAQQLLDVQAPDLGLRLHVSLHEAKATSPAEMGDLEREVSLPVASDFVRLRARAEVAPLSWQDRISRQAGIGIAALAGLLFTLAALHVYLMLISTRRRAREMSHDMSVALHSTQTRNQAVMDTAPDAILMLDGDGRVRWCNQATTSIFGLTSDDLLGRQLGTVLPALGEGAMHDWFSTYGFSNRVIGYETTGLRNEGVSFPVAVSASRAEVEGALIQTFIVRDTTDAKWAEQELSLRDRALASSADGVVIVSMTLPNQPMIYVNHAFEQISGYEAHEMLGLNCRMFQKDDQQQPGIAVMREAIREGRSCQVVLRNYRKNGALFYNDLAISPVLSPEGVLTHFVGVATDITDRIAAEQVLQLRTERLNAVFDLSPDGFVVLDKRGEVSIVNPAFERMTGLVAADLVGRSRSAFEEHLMERCQASEVDGHTAAGVMAGASEADAAVAATQELLHMHTPCVRTLVRRVRQGGHDNETVMYFRDITHELEVDRMKSEFLAMAAHELRTPMVSIFGFTELLLKRNFTDERRNDMLATIHRQASVLINLVNELLDLARIESRRGKDFKRERQQLQQLIENTVAGLLMHNDPRKVDVTLPSERIVVDVDREKLSLALTNVLSNAHKYSPRGGDITLDLVWRDREGRTECGIRVTDQGLGMTQEQQDKVFDRFFRADTSGNIPGTGLGMTIVKEIVELHGGQVSITSEFGVGTTVILWVPCMDPGALAPTEAAPQAVESA